MLVARRDPPFESGAHGTHENVYAHLQHPRHSRFVSALQILGTLVAIPVGLATIYSVYHSSFTVEARCDTLRANIVSLLDKNADATTLRMLAGRDVTAFEAACSAVDPDAVKAFKHLLTMQHPPFPPPPPQAAQEPVKRAAETVKPVPAPKPAVVDAKAVRTETKVSEPKPADLKASAKQEQSPPSDENWVASVREALTHSPAQEDGPDAAAAAAAASSAAPSQLAPPPRALGTLPTSLIPPEAPSLPPPVAVAAPPAPPPAADHPVPPGSIPEATLAEKPAEPSNHSWMSKVPILNRVVGN